jgi:tetratricopeptide (TPR) repeat protein
MALTHYNWGYACGELREYKFAKEHYDLAKQYSALTIEYFNTDKKLRFVLVDVYRGIGNAHAQLNEMEEAMKWFDKAIEIEPNFPYVYNTKGYVLNLQEKYKDAIKCFDDAIEKDPGFGRALRNKGYALNCLGRLTNDKESEKIFREALDCIDRAISLEPRDTFSWFYKGYSYIYLEKYEEAIGCFDKAIEIQPDFAYAYTSKGVTLYYLKKFDQAIECFDKAIDISKEKLSLTFESARTNWIKQLGDAYNSKGYTLIKKMLIIQNVKSSLLK